ncbi:MAG: transporter associated domain-containing protein, partial [Streptococcus sp.]|nr:transporter associated domain-containing protein [Streptococcus sp.]
ELESDDVDTIAGYYLTGVGNIPDQDSRETFEVDTKEKHLALTNDKVKDGRVTKLKVIFSDIEQSIEED